MLEGLRRQGASIFIYLIFCLLIAIFVINFRPGQSRNDESGCSGPNNLIVSVDGGDVTQTAYHIAYSNPYNRGTGKQRAWVALEMLIRRELLADEAVNRGLLVNNGLVEEEIKKGHFYFGGQELTIPGIFDENGLWNYTAFKRWFGMLNVSKASYETEQERSLLASLMGQLIKDAVIVSRDEALAEFLYDHTLVSYDVVAFSAEDYKSAIKLTDADVDRFIATHGDVVEKRYKQDERTYKGVKKQLKLREVFIANPANAGSAAAPEAVRSTIEKAGDEGKAKLEAARAAIASGKQKFADVAKDLATDAEMKAQGGAVGWRGADNAMLGEKAVNDAVKSLKPGEMTPVVTTDKGAYLVMVEDSREGDLKFEQVKRELAEEIAKDEWSKEKARREAQRVLDEAHGGKALADMFEREKAEPYMAPIEIKKQIKQLVQMQRSGQLPEEFREQLQQQLIQLEQYLQAQRKAILSLREVTAKDEPASWDATGGSGAGAGSAAPATPPKPEDKPVDYSKDTLPAFGDVKLKVTKEGPAPRMTSMPGIGKSKAAADALFDELSFDDKGKGQIAKQVFDAEGKYVVVQLVEKTQPKIEDFDKEANEDLAELRDQRAGEALDQWLKDRCEKLAKDEKIKVNLELVRETDDKGNPLPTQYKPCMTFR